MLFFTSCCSTSDKRTMLSWGTFHAERIRILVTQIKRSLVERSIYEGWWQKEERCSYLEDFLDERPHRDFFFLLPLGWRTGSASFSSRISEDIFSILSDMELVGEIGSIRGTLLLEPSSVGGAESPFETGTTATISWASRVSFDCFSIMASSSPSLSSGMGRSSWVIALSCGSMVSVDDAKCHWDRRIYVTEL